MFNSLGLDDNAQPENVTDVYIMSFVRPYRGNITWSPQSRDKIKSQLKKKSCLRDNTKAKNSRFDGNNEEN